jgi:XTP/dITP diphosphohydrolase
MVEIIFATNNEHKVQEIQSVVGNKFQIVTLMEAGINIDIPEPHDSLKKNAFEKSSTIYQLTGKNCFSEDTGLEVDALNGEPGVKSARYAGETRDFERNIDKLLKKLEGTEDREARFRTIISLILNDEEHFFEGICEGKIEKQRKGVNGFGYDPVFTPLNSSKTFGEMTLEEKNMYSHRKKATDKLVLFLQDAATAMSMVHRKTK